MNNIEPLKNETVLPTQAWNGRCPKCLGETEVLEKWGAFRRRRCRDKQCGLVFDTRESIETGMEFRRIRAIGRKLNR
jgi:hypothetical protein